MNQSFRHKTSGNGSGRPRRSRRLVLVGAAARATRVRWGRGLQENFDVHESTKLDDLKNSLETLKPDILLLDHAFPGLGGVEAVPAVRSLSKATKIILLAEHTNQKEGIIALKSGARAYCDAGSDPELIKKVVESVLKGEVWVNRNLVPDLIEELALLTARRQAGARRNRVSLPRTGH